VIQRKLLGREPLLGTLQVCGRRRVWGMLLILMQVMIINRFLVVMISIEVSMSMIVCSGGGSTGQLLQLRRHLQVGLAVAVDARVEPYVSGIRVCPCRLVYASTWQAPRCCLALCLCASMALHDRRHWLLLAVCLVSSARPRSGPMVIGIGPRARRVPRKTITVTDLPQLETAARASGPIIALQIMGQMCRVEGSM